MIVHSILMGLFPGSEEWLWRRACFVSAVTTEIWNVARAATDATITAHGVILLGLFAAWSATAVADDHLKRKVEAGTTT